MLSMLECWNIVPGSLKQVEEEEKRVLMEVDDSDDSIDAGLKKVPHNVMKIKYFATKLRWLFESE